MLEDKFASELVIGTVCNHELHLISQGERAQVLHSKAASFARSWTLDIHDFMDLRRHIRQGTLAACFKQNFVTVIQKALHQGNYFALLKHRLTAGNLNQFHWSKLLHLRQYLVYGHFVSAGEGVFTVTPRAAQVASGQTHEDAR